MPVTNTKNYFKRIVKIRKINLVLMQILLFHFIVCYDTRQLKLSEFLKAAFTPCLIAWFVVYAI
jgi:hypothetical protein